MIVKSSQEFIPLSILHPLSKVRSPGAKNYTSEQQKANIEDRRRNVIRSALDS